MRVRCLMTEGNGHFYETEYDCPTDLDDSIIVKNIMTGVCRSDIDMMQGNFGPLPLHMQGHEGLGQVIEIGKNIRGPISLGDYVATRGEPAYADYYSVREGEYVRVPEAHPRYIIEPVACGINLIHSVFSHLKGRENKKTLVMGSGFLSYIAYNFLQSGIIGSTLESKIDIVGSSNKDIWQEAGVSLLSSPNENYDVIIDLNGNVPLFLNPNIIRNNGLVIEGVSRDISKQENEHLLWRSVTTVRPSPRTSTFYSAMGQAVVYIRNGEINVDKFWTKSYNRNTEWQQAFADGANRPAGYSRGYIVW